MLQIPQQRFHHMIFGSCQKFFRISPPQLRHSRAFILGFAKDAVFQPQPKQFHIQFSILSALKVGKHLIQRFKLKIMIYGTDDRIEIKICVAVLIKGNIHRLQGIVLCGVPNLIDGTTLRNLSVFHQRSPNSFPKSRSCGILAAMASATNCRSKGSKALLMIPISSARTAFNPFSIR